MTPSTLTARTEYISVGGNRHPSAADWDKHTGILAFGANNNVALWDPTDKYQTGVYELLTGHTDEVNAVKFYTLQSSDCGSSHFLLTGSTDRTIRVWRRGDDKSIITSTRPSFSQVATVHGHEGSINCIAVTCGSELFVSGAADGTVRVWRLREIKGNTDDDAGAAAPTIDCQLIQTITLRPRFFALALALRVLDGKKGGEKKDAESAPSVVLAVGGTRTTIHIYVLQEGRGDTEAEGHQFELKASLTGHEAWVRSLAFTDIDAGKSQSQLPDLFLASASQDKYIRLWRIHAGDDVAPARNGDDDEGAISARNLEQTLSNKAHEFEASGSKYSITFEALLFGHEDWIYTVAWNSDPKNPKLLSASADNSLVIWESDPVSGVWYSAARMGEISAQKGSTTATGSIGGFWIGLWSPRGEKVVSLGRTGSWRLWRYENEMDLWVQNIAVTGHVRSVNGIEWEPTDGGYLLSTSSDQTTRLHSRWKHDDKDGGCFSWHEFSRPQIHGYDLNCIASLGPWRFVSGADEKLLRVFNQTKAIANLLERLTGFTGGAKPADMPEAANIPVLGLSNKAADDDVDLGHDGEGDVIQSDSDPKPSTETSALHLPHPPLEDHLSKYTLWPEHEKLYGHGYEISAVATSHDGTLVASACKASSLDHAVIRLYDAAATTWHEIKPPLAAHSLTVTCLRFSADDRFLVSVGRDRQWAVWRREGSGDGKRDVFRLLCANPRAHARMILSASWAPIMERSVPRAFATAGRDKTVKLWMQEQEQDQRGSFTCKATISLPSPVTAIDILPMVIGGDRIYLAVGLDTGRISVHALAIDGLGEAQEVIALPALECPSRAITQVAWRPVGVEGKEVNEVYELALASEDSSVRVIRISDL
ncbi:RNA polymerase II 90 kDa subunit [Histoplasma capsulatum var. duboisii H88]|uniref:Elongator complex protein 2 n=1 Tax=Ajellomyces capsulatus (strain H88) TaxID=544711 RepID=F0UQY3_AJEC8|nr:RNA polymerase II 90 kDa subunit [Histoplasma capsulatum var. duboisii H88]QSS50338.1 RNA polymerase II 90 kDa subunit [Histoplasma capsulatum var. duboisii H88]